VTLNPANIELFSEQAEALMRIALGGITHEANSFCAHVTEMADFEARQVLRGDEILSNWQSTSTEQAGAMSVLIQVPGCGVAPTFLARSLCGAPMYEPVFSELLEELLTALKAAGPVDGVLLVLHGAMISQATPDATGKVLERVRALVGPDVPVVGTLDLHANVTARMVREATALIGYHTAPHVDMYETGQKAAQVLVAAIEGDVRPTTWLVRLPMLLPPENSTHNWGALADVIGRAVALEAEGAIIHGGIYPVQPWMDTPDVACSVVVITDDSPQAAGPTRRRWRRPSGRAGTTSCRIWCCRMRLYAVHWPATPGRSCSAIRPMRRRQVLPGTARRFCARWWMLRLSRRSRWPMSSTRR